MRLRNASSRTWQVEGWRVYNNLGEINFAFNLIAEQVARIRLHAAVMLAPDEPPTEIADAVTLPTGTRELGAANGIDAALAQRARELLAELDRGYGLATIQRLYALNRLIAGECYLCQIQGQWSIKSTFEVVVDPSGVMRLQPSISTQTALPEELPAGSQVWRMWTRHPQYSLDPDCGLRAVLYLCEQLIKLNRMISNAVASRMNAGMLLVASEIIQAARQAGAEADGVNDEDSLDGGQVELDPFRADLHATMIQPIQDDAAGATVIPMVAEVPFEYMQGGIQHLMLSRDVDQHMITYAENLLTRILNGISIPKDAITGFQNVRFTNAQQITRDLFEQAIEPVSLAIVDDLTDVYLRPLLMAEAEAGKWDPEQVKKIVVWYDPSEIVTRPDRGADADAGWDRGALSDDAWRKAHGFSAEDRPDEKELITRTLLRSVLPPGMIDYGLRELLPDYFKDAPPLEQGAPGGAGAPVAPTPGQPTGLGGRPTHAFSNPSGNPGNAFTRHIRPAGSDDQELPPEGSPAPRVVGQ